MEENIYNRQITKLAVSKRVVDKCQIDRHYTENDIATLYRSAIEPKEPRNINHSPRDHLLARLLTRYPECIHKYQEHDSLLENKLSETLTPEEISAAWTDFSAAKEETHRRPRRISRKSGWKRQKVSR